MAKHYLECLISFLMGIKNREKMEKENHKNLLMISKHYYGHDLLSLNLMNFY